MSSDALKSVPFPLPTLEHPFGVELWPIFDKAFSAVMGYPPASFRFVPGQSPMSTLTATSTMLLTYYATVFTGRELMKNRAPFKLNGLFMIHNFYLTVISGCLLALFIEQLLPTIWNRGLFFAICDHKGGWTDQLVVLYYVGSAACMGRRGVANFGQLNHLTKYVELLDTIFLVVKKKPLSTIFPPKLELC